MKTDEKNVLNLCERMMDGLTSEDEETFLTDFFASNPDVPDSLKCYKTMFSLLTEDKIDFTEKEINQFVEERKRRVISCRIWKPLAVAASITIVCLFGWWKFGLQTEKNSLEPSMEKAAHVVARTKPQLVFHIVKQTVVHHQRVGNSIFEKSRVIPVYEGVDKNSIKWELNAAVDDNVPETNLLTASGEVSDSLKKVHFSKELTLSAHKLSLTDEEIVNEMLSEVLFEIRSEQRQLLHENEDIIRISRQVNKESCAY